MKHFPAGQQAMLSEALSLPLAERGVFLARACGPDLDLLAHLVALIAAHEEPDNVLEFPQPPKSRQPVAPSGFAFAPGKR